MIAAGTMIEVGQLEDGGGALGIVIQRPNGELVTIKGLTPDETRAAAKLLFQAVAVTLAPGAETPP